MTQPPIQLGKRRTPPPAAATPLPANLALAQPLPPGRLIQPKIVTDGERKLLTAAGWRDGDPVPENLADQLDLLRQEVQADLDNPPLPIAADSPPLQYKEVDIADLDPAEQQRTRTVLNSILKQAKQAAALEKEASQLDPSLQQVLRQTEEPALEAGPPAGMERLEPTSEQNSAGPAVESSQTTCAYCGYRAGQHLDPLSEDDKDAYMEALQSLQPFTKVVPLYGNRLSVRIRGVTVEENDLCWQQVSKDFQEGKVKIVADQNEQFARYRTGLQLVGIEGLKQPVAIPQTLAAWSNELGIPPSTRLVVAIWESWQQIVQSESLHRILVGAVIDFNNLVRRLEAKAIDPNF